MTLDVKAHVHVYQINPGNVVLKIVGTNDLITIYPEPCDIKKYGALIGVQTTVTIKLDVPG